MEAALTHAAFVVAERQHPLTLAVIPLRLAGDDREAGQVALGVVVLVTLFGLPSKEALLGDP